MKDANETQMLRLMVSRSEVSYCQFCWNSEGAEQRTEHSPPVSSGVGGVSWFSLLLILILLHGLFPGFCGFHRSLKIQQF